MNYPVDEFVADYQAAIESARSGEFADLKSGKALRKPFEAQYHGDIFQERMRAFRSVMEAIDQQRKKLADLEYVRLGPDSRVTWMHQNLVLALHRLIVEQDKPDPSIDEIKQAMDFFIFRN